MFFAKKAKKLSYTPNISKKPSVISLLVLIKIKMNINVPEKRATKITKLVLLVLCQCKLIKTQSLKYAPFCSIAFMLSTVSTIDLLERPSSSLFSFTVLLLHSILYCVHKYQTFFGRLLRFFLGCNGTEERIDISLLLLPFWNSLTLIGFTKL